MEKRERLNLEVATPVRHRLENLAEKTSQNLSQTTRVSIDILEAIIEAQAKGGKLIIRNPDGTERELLVV